MLVARFLTPVPLEDLVPALDAAHHEFRGWSLTPDAYAIAAAMLELEHGTAVVNGRRCLRAVWDDNLGNHDETLAERADPSVPGFVTVPERELDAGGGEYRAEHVRRAYPDAVEGARGFWQVLLDRFEAAYDACDAGDAQAFVEALKAEKYFTGDEAAYARFVAREVPAWLDRIAAAGGV